MRQFFRKEDRLSKYTSEIIEKGKRVKKSYIIVYFKQMDRPKLTVIIGRKAANSVLRNRVKRWVREIFRQNKHRLKDYGMAVVIKPNNREYSYAEISANLLSILQESSLLKKNV